MSRGRLLYSLGEAEQTPEGARKMVIPLSWGVCVWWLPILILMLSFFFSFLASRACCSYSSGNTEISMCVMIRGEITQKEIPMCVILRREITQKEIPVYYIKKGDYIEINPYVCYIKRGDYTERNPIISRREITQPWNAATPWLQCLLPSRGSSPPPPFPC